MSIGEDATGREERLSISLPHFQAPLSRAKV